MKLRKYRWSPHFGWYCSLSDEGELIFFRHHNIRNVKGQLKQDIYYHRFDEALNPPPDKWTVQADRKVEELLDEDERLGRLELTDAYFLLRWQCADILSR